MKRPKFLIRAFGVLMAAVLAFLTLVPAAFASDDLSLSDALFYGRAGSGATVYLDGAELVDLLGFSDVTADERTVLGTHAVRLFSYENRISTSYITAQFYEEEGVQYVRVSARKYAYTADNGARVEWLPCAIRLSESSVPLTESAESYTGQIAVPGGDSVSSVYVEYQTQITLPAHTVGRIGRLAYDTALSAAEAIKEGREDYLSRLAAYETACDDYDGYLSLLSAYQLKYAVYEAYLDDLCAYEEAMARYTAFLAAREKYEEDLAAYEQYLSEYAKYQTDLTAYQVYLSAVEHYEEEYAAYEAYLAERDACLLRLSVLEALKTPVTDLERDLYSSILGETVAEVLSRKDELTTLGASQQVINSAGDATVSLRNYFDSYFSLSSDEEKYAYYVSNYAGITSAFNRLLKSLDSLYREPKIRAAIILKEKGRKFVILLAQLYYVTRALNTKTLESTDGSYRFDGSWTIEGWETNNTRYTPAGVIGSDGYFSYSTDPVPTGPFPETVECPTEPTPKTPPRPPKAVDAPTSPVPVTEPQAPQTVPEPLPPAPVPPPGDAPVPFVPTEEQSYLKDCMDRGVLRNREDPASDVTLTLHTSVRKTVNGETVALSFYDRVGGTLLYSAVVDKNSAVTYEGAIPTRAQDARAEYAFTGWQTEDGAPYDLSSAEHGASLYAAFSETLKSYPVSFSWEGGSSAGTYLYGQTPEVPTVPAYYDTATHRYTFRSFSPKILPVEGPAEYTALYDESVLLPLDGGFGTVRIAGDTLLCETGDDVSVTDMTTILSISVENDLKLTLKFAKGTVTFTQEEVRKMRDGGVKKLALSASFDALGTGDVSLLLTDGAGAPVGECGAFVLLSHPLSHDPDRIAVLDGTQKIPAAASDGMLCLSVTGGKSLSVRRLYRVFVMEAVGGSVSCSETYYLPGETVSVSVVCDRGRALDVLFAADSDGESLAVSDSCFTMPASDVTVGALTREVLFEILFKVNGTVYRRQRLRLDDEIVFPTLDVIEDEGGGRYAFLGWRLDGEWVSGSAFADSDRVYEADFALIPREETDEIPESVILLRRIGLYAAAIFAALVAVGVPVLYVRACLRRRRRNRYR